MKILALDSSGLVASVAVMEDDNLIAEYTMNHKKTHSQTLVPMMDEVRSMVELDLSTIDAIAVAAGPGSFTGLRIGSATEQADYTGSYSRCTGVQSLCQRQRDLPVNGRKKESGLYRII